MKGLIASFCEGCDLDQTTWILILSALLCLHGKRVGGRLLPPGSGPPRLGTARRLRNFKAHIPTGISKGKDLWTFNVCVSGRPLRSTAC